jgi:hypothetical protein
MASILAATAPESGKGNTEFPSGTHVHRKVWDDFPYNARQFFGILKNHHRAVWTCI